MAIFFLFLYFFIFFLANIQPSGILLMKIAVRPRDSRGAKVHGMVDASYEVEMMCEGMAH